MRTLMAWVHEYFTKGYSGVARGDTEPCAVTHSPGGVKIFLVIPYSKHLFVAAARRRQTIFEGTDSVLVTKFEKGLKADRVSLFMSEPRPNPPRGRP